MMAALCNYSLPSSLVTGISCHSKWVGSALGLWGLRVLLYFCFFCLIQYVCVDRQVNKAFSLKSGPLEVFVSISRAVVVQFCASVCVFPCMCTRVFDLNQLSTPQTLPPPPPASGSGLVSARTSAKLCG